MKKIMDTENIIHTYFPKNKILFDEVIKQLKLKFQPPSLQKCSCCGKKKQFMRYYLGRTKLCSKGCYKSYYNMSDYNFYREHNC